MGEPKTWIVLGLGFLTILIVRSWKHIRDVAHLCDDNAGTLPEDDCTTL